MKKYLIKSNRFNLILMWLMLVICYHSIIASATEETVESQYEKFDKRVIEERKNELEKINAKMQKVIKLNKQKIERDKQSLNQGKYVQNAQKKINCYNFNHTNEQNAEKRVPNGKYYFGSNRDQGPMGLCWAHQGVDLIQELFCIEDPQNCEKKLSVLDFSRDLDSKANGFVWNFEKNDNDELEGTDSFNQILKFLNNKKGICFEEDAPYLFNDKVRDSYKAKESVIKLLSEIEKIKSNECSDKNKDNQIKLQIEEISKILSINICCNSDKISKYKCASCESDLLRKMFIPEGCKKNRQKLKKNYDLQMINSEGWDGKNPQGPFRDEKKINEMFEFLTESFKAGVSVGLNLCTEPPSQNDPKCGGHAVIVNGMRYNEEKGSCEIHLRNSWGELYKGKFSGWVDMKNVLYRTLEVFSAREIK
ncbi:MAG: hypothetical protein HQK49_07680 [Oligoflexia bacterium]|nr:hypothetical protein [Oligoflexia bacterium]